MSEHEGHAARAVYDHEVDDTRLTGRRRTVADWGVGEELFDRMPRRRFRPSDAHRRDAHRTGRFEPAGESRGHVAERDEARVRGQERRRPATREDDARGRVEDARRPAAREDEARGRGEEARRPATRDDATRRADEPRRPAPSNGRSAVPVEPPAAPVEPPAALEPIAAPIDHVAPPPEGRRTVVIRGHGAEPAWTPRRRPPRTVGERIGPRPDRLAAWAVALGMLLILIAILTAHG